jgi:hypothetical protein
MAETRAASFKMPPDVIRRLGGGDTIIGYAALRDTFNLPLAEPLGQIPAEAVEAIGGRPVLQRFIAKVRRQRITKARA